MKLAPKIPSSTDVWTLAVERVVRLYDRFDELAVSFSGGKDSTATLQVALEAARRCDRLPVRVFFYDEECIPLETEQYVRRVAERPDVALEWYCLPVKHRNACSRRDPWWWPWAPEARELWARPLPPEALTELAGFPLEPPAARLTIPDTNGLMGPPERGEVCLLLGIRAAESIVRQRAVRGRSGPDNYVHKVEGRTARPNVWKAYPVYDWTTQDVWTAPAKLGWDYNRAYDLQAMAGVTPDAQRCSPAFGEEPLQKLWIFATCFPDVWERMVYRVPGVGSAYRYALTELYGFQGLPAKPEGMTWPDFVLYFLEKHNDEGRARTVERLKAIIATHYFHTTEPILPTARHPESGVSYRQIMSVAMRGDFKSRRIFVGGKPGTDQWTRMRAAYDAERAELERSGLISEC